MENLPIFIGSLDGTEPQIITVNLPDGAATPISGRGHGISLSPGWGVVADEPLDSTGKLRLYVPRLGDQFHVRLTAGIGFADEANLLLSANGQFEWGDDLPGHLVIDDPANLMAILYGTSWADFLAPAKVPG